MYYFAYCSWIFQTTVSIYATVSYKAAPTAHWFVSQQLCIWDGCFKTEFACEQRWTSVNVHVALRTTLRSCRLKLSTSSHSRLIFFIILFLQPSQNWTF